MIVAHIMGVPVEEYAPQFLPVAAAMLSASLLAGRARLGRLRDRLLRRG